MIFFFFVIVAFPLTKKNSTMEHPMSNLCPIQMETLKTIRQGWEEPIFSKFDLPNVTIQFSAYEHKTNLSYKTKFAGAIMDLKKTKFQLKCIGANCKGTFQLDKNSLDSNLKIYKGRVECLIIHTCERFTNILKAVKYAEFLRRYIKKKSFVQNSLKSNVGFLFDEVKTLRECRIYVFDHEFKPLGKFKKSVTADKFTCESCKVIVAKVRRDGPVCQLASASGAKSLVLSPMRFLYEKNDQIPQLNKQCQRPFYIRAKKKLNNIFSYGLTQIIPELTKMIGIFGWSAHWEEDYDGGNIAEDDDDDTRSNFSVDMSVDDTRSNFTVDMQVDEIVDDTAVALDDNQQSFVNVETDKEVEADAFWTKLIDSKKIERIYEEEKAKESDAFWRKLIDSNKIEQIYQEEMRGNE